MANTVSIKKELVLWAISESQRPVDFLLPKKKYLQKLIDTGKATFAQLKDFATLCHVPFGFLFLSCPPAESSLSPSFRTIKNIHPGVISQDLKQMITDMEFKRDWMSAFREEGGFSPIKLSNRIVLGDSIVKCACSFRSSFGLSKDWFASVSDEKASFDFLRSKAEGVGFIVMESGIVGNNTKRKLDTKEFRGFFLSDPFAPLVFINSSDTATAKIFTLVHECCHALIDGGEDLLTNSEDTEKERFINSIVAEVLMPNDIVQEYAAGHNLENVNGVTIFGKYFKTSLTSSAYRLHKLGLISKALDDEINQIVANGVAKSKHSGGDFYATLHTRISHSFLRAVVNSVNNEATTYTEGFNLLGVSSYSSFEKLSSFADAKDRA